MMPPGTEPSLDFFHLLVAQPQIGLLFGAMALAIWYLQRELKSERIAHAATSTQLLAVTREAVAANVASTTVVAALRSLVERHLIGNNRDRRDD